MSSHLMQHSSLTNAGAVAAPHFTAPTDDTNTRAPNISHRGLCKLRYKGDTTAPNSHVRQCGLTTSSIN